MKRIASLDGLRGVAVLFVVMFHFLPRNGAGPISLLASFGWTGVDIFFVLSGFLITSILYEERGSENYFRNFYIRRSLRLFPLYYFIFILILVLTPFQHTQWRPRHLAIVFYGANLVLPYDDSLAFLGPFDIYHLWSLSVEEQFYLIWPCLVGSRLTNSALRNICITGILAAPVLRLALLQIHVEPWLIYQSLPTRMDSLLVGAALALVPLPSLRMARVVSGSALLIYSLLAWRGHLMYLLSRPIQGFGYSALALFSGSVLVLGIYPTTIVHRVCSQKALRMLGRYSYGICIWHYLFFRQWGIMSNWILYRMPFPLVVSIFIFVIALSVSTLLAMTSYRFLEQPFLELKQRYGR